MRRALLYLGGLLLASVAVFLAVYLGGRRPSLEEELARLRREPPTPAVREQGIPSLRGPATPPPSGPVLRPDREVENTVAEGIVVARSPLVPPALALVLDLDAVGAGYRDAVAAFLELPPVEAEVAVRSITGGPGDCGRSISLRRLGPWDPGTLRTALEGGIAMPRGPRNPAVAVEEAVADLEAAPGQRSVIVIAAAGEECGTDPCAASTAGGTAPARVHAVLLVSPEEAEPASRPGFAAFYDAPDEPAWVAGYRCLAERTGGSVALVSNPGDLGRRLRLIAQGLESAIVVRAFHADEVEVRGIAPEGFEWGASLTARSRDDGEVTVRLSPAMPAVFSVPAGTWDLRCQYDGVLRRAPVAVAPGEQAEVSVTFATGEVFVEARDGLGGEIAGDSAGFGCLWGVEIFPEEGGAESAAVASTCALPARVELPAGGYRARVRWKDREELLPGFVVEAGGTTVRSVDFSAPEPGGSDEAGAAGEADATDAADAGDRADAAGGGGAPPDPGEALPEPPAESQ